MSKATKNPPAATRGGSIDGDLIAARMRLLRFAEIAAAEIDDAVSLNALSITISAHLIGLLGPQALKLYDQIKADLDSEHAKDWTIRLRNEKWAKA